MKPIAAFLLAIVTGQAHADFVFFDGFEDGARPVSGAVVISEIMSNPTAVDDALGEWIEIANVSDQALELGNCTVGDTAPVTLPALTIAADDFALLVRSSMQGSNGGLPADATFSFALGATGTLRLICDGNLIDQTSWSSSELAGSSRSLDPGRFTGLANDDPGNWCFATALYNSSDKGSPGLPNAPCPGIGDPGTPPAPGELSITELMIDPAVLADTDAEWVELRSLAAGTRDLAGCVLNNGTTDSAAFPSIALAPGAYALAGRSTNSSLNGGLVVDATFAFTLTNGSGTLSVKCQGIVIDSLAWASSIVGRSLQRDPVSPSNLCTAPAGTPSYTDSNVGTPKADNPPCQ